MAILKIQDIYILVKDIILKEMTDKEHLDIADFSFTLFVEELARSSGRYIEEVRKTAGGPPINRTENDLWKHILLDSKKVGYIWVKIEPQKKEAFGYEIFLNEEHRGKGLGRQAMLKGKKLLKEINISKLNICVFEKNLPARRLYESLGFKTSKIDKKINQHHLYLEI